MKLAIAIALIPLLLNVFATRLVHRDEYSEKAQKIAQLLFVWLVPIIGAIAIWGMYRSLEKSPGTYRETPDPGDDFGASGTSLQSLRDALDTGND
jgi:hypothetical protein